MCGCSGKAKIVAGRTSGPSGTTIATKYELTDGGGKKHTFDKQADAYFARARLGGTVKPVSG